MENPEQGRYILHFPDCQQEGRKGTFAITDETTYVEHITGSITDPSLVNKDNIIKYTFTTDNTMTLTYRMPGAAKEAVEMWTRVKMAMPGQER